MATKSKEFDVTDDLPEEFNAETNSGQALGIDELQGIGFKTQQEEEERAKLNPPAGDWEKDDVWQFRLMYISDDSQPDDFKPEKGRMIFNFTGKPVERQSQGRSYQPVLFIRMSPDKRYKQDKPDEIDHAHKMYLRAKDLYLSLYGESIDTKDQTALVSMMVEDNYVVRTMNGDSGPFVLDIKQKRTARR